MHDQLARLFAREQELTDLLEAIRADKARDLADLAASLAQIQAAVHEVQASNQSLLKSSQTPLLLVPAAQVFAESAQRIALKRKYQLGDRDSFSLRFRLTFNAVRFRDSGLWAKDLPSYFSISAKIGTFAFQQNRIILEEQADKVDQLLGEERPLWLRRESDRRAAQLEYQLGCRLDPEQFSHVYRVMDKGLLRIDVSAQKACLPLGVAFLPLPDLLYYRQSGEDAWAVVLPLLAPTGQRLIGELQLMLANRRVDKPKQALQAQHTKAQRRVLFDKEEDPMKLDPEQRKSLRIRNYKELQGLEEAPQQVRRREAEHSLMLAKAQRQKSKQAVVGLAFEKEVEQVVYLYCCVPKFQVIQFTNPSDRVGRFVCRIGQKQPICQILTDLDQAAQLAKSKSLALKNLAKINQDLVFQLHQGETASLMLRFATQSEDCKSVHVKAKVTAQNSDLALRQYSFVVKSKGYLSDIQVSAYTKPNAPLLVAFQRLQENVAHSYPLTTGAGSGISTLRGLALKMLTSDRDSAPLFLFYQDRTLGTLLQSVRVSLHPCEQIKTTVSFGVQTIVSVGLNFFLEPGIQFYSSDPALLRYVPGSSANFIIQSRFTQPIKVLVVCHKGEEILKRWLMNIQTISATPMAIFQLSLRSQERKSIYYKFTNRRDSKNRILITALDKHLAQAVPRQLHMNGGAKADVEVQVRGRGKGQRDCWVCFRDQHEHCDFLLVRLRVQD